MTNILKTSCSLQRAGEGEARCVVVAAGSACPPAGSPEASPDPWTLQLEDLH